MNRSLETYLANAKGVIHVGANTGQERDDYARYRLPVVWVEPIKECFEYLVKHVSAYPEQVCLQALVTHTDGDDCTLYVSDNNGQSSSILHPQAHLTTYPEVNFIGVRHHKSVTLDTLVAREGIDPAPFDTLVLDVQGSELLVLAGAKSLLPRLRYVRAEVWNYQAYKGCAQRSEVSSFLGRYGLVETSVAHNSGNHPPGCMCWEILYSR
jgi:FkbM family methyltransferase